MESKSAKPIKIELVDSESTVKDGHRKVENIEKNTSSKISSSFAKRHRRSNNSFGDGHEPGIIPGTGV